jgi:hypothetical protein
MKCYEVTQWNMNRHNSSLDTPGDLQSHPFCTPLPELPWGRPVFQELENSAIGRPKAGDGGSPIMYSRLGKEGFFFSYD